MMQISLSSASESVLIVYGRLKDVVKAERMNIGTGRKN
jgi:hypothetical protein